MSRGASILLTVAVVLLFCGATTVTGFIGREISENEAERNSRCYITYELNGGTNSDKNPAYFKSGEGAQLEDPSYDGHVFTGWYSDPELTNKIDYIEKGTTADVTVYAGWKNSLVGTLLTYDYSGTYTHNAVDRALSGKMTYEFIDYDKTKGYQTKVQQMSEVDIGSGNSLKSAAKETSWENDDTGYTSTKNGDVSINTAISGTITCEKWTYVKTEQNKTTTQVQYEYNEIPYIIEINENEGNEVTVLTYNLTGINDQSKTIITKNYTWTYNAVNYNMNLSISMTDFVNSRTDTVCSMLSIRPRHAGKF